MYDDNQEKRTAGDALFSGYRKVSNFLYHYKFALLAGIAVLSVTLVAIVQCAARVDPDVDIVFAVPVVFDHHDMSAIRADLVEILGEDLNDDGRTYVNITRFHFLSDAQTEVMRARGEIVNHQAIRVAQQQLALEILTGANLIFFLSPEAYRATRRRAGDINNFMFVDHALGFMPPRELLFDDEGFAIRLSMLPVFEHFEGIGVFPEDTLLVFRDFRDDDPATRVVDERYERNLLMFRRIVGFTPE